MSAIDYDAEAVAPPPLLWWDAVAIVQDRAGAIHLVGTQEATATSATADVEILQKRLAVATWSAEASQFLPSEEDPVALQQDAMSVLPTLGIYGVLPLGRSSVLMYIVERQEAAKLPGGHMVHEILRLGSRVLPCASLGSRSPASQTASEGQPRAPCTTTGAAAAIASSATPVSHPQQAPQPALSGDVLREYLRHVEMFCDGARVGGLHLHVCFTRDVAASFGTRPGTAAGGGGGGAGGRRSPTPPQGLRSCTPHSAWGAPPPRSSSTYTCSGSSADGAQLDLFQWNAPLAAAFGTRLDHHGACAFVAPVMRGTVAAFCSVGSRPEAAVHCALVTRLSWRNAGTRYNRRGVDDEGWAANFCESEVVVWCGARGSSFTLVRGSVPLAWCQPADLTLKPAVAIDRERSPSLLHDHFAILDTIYDPRAIHCVDLMSLRNALEAELSAAFSQEIAALAHESGNEAGSRGRTYDDGLDESIRCTTTSSSSSSSDAPHDNINKVRYAVGGVPAPRCVVTYTHIDLSRLLKQTKSFDDLSATVVRVLQPMIDEVGHTVWDGTPASAAPPQQWQCGVLRINCLDCLDRTNAAQFFAAEVVLFRQVMHVLAPLGADEISAAARTHMPSLLRALSAAWVTQGNVASKCYTGRNALMQEVVGRRSLRTLRGKAEDGLTAVRRFVQQNFFDGEKQDIIAVVTRTHDPLPQARMKNSNPFERHMRTLNVLVFAGLFVGLIMWGGSVAVLAYSPQWRWELVVAHALWTSFVGMVIWFIRRDAPSYTNYPLLL